MKSMPLANKRALQSVQRSARRTQTSMICEGIDGHSPIMCASMKAEPIADTTIQCGRKCDAVY
jgi:hypothetical protein